MNLLLSVAENVIEALGHHIRILDNPPIETKGILFRNPIRNDLSEYIQSEKVCLYVLDSIEVSTGLRVVYKDEEFEITRISMENGTKKLGLKCPKEQKLETLFP
jgi:hypothetical protein